VRSIRILSGGAAQGLVAELAETFTSQTGFAVGGEFGAVGLMADKLRQGEAADLVVLTHALVVKLADEGLVVASSITDVGKVETALAARAGDLIPKSATASDVRDAFLEADAIFVPDIKSSTAGIHVAKMLDQLGIASEVASHLRIFPNGATAMRQLAASDDRRPIGCTQATEILATTGVALCGPLPSGLDLVTTYSAGTTTRSANARTARALMDLLSSGQQRQLRQRIGFAD
jgi:molybdate transport system substrate-binding protein